MFNYLHIILWKIVFQNSKLMFFKKHFVKYIIKSLINIKLRLNL